jgi:hypothetical protein
MSDNEKESTGVDVNSDITPITKRPIQAVAGHEWSQMSLSDLHDQLITLQNRYYMMLQMGKGEIADQILMGIKRIESIISQKQLEAQQKGSYNVRPN